MKSSFIATSRFYYLIIAFHHYRIIPLSIKFVVEPNKVLNRGLVPELLDRPKKMKTLPKVLTKEEIAGIVRIIQNEKHKIMVFLAYSSGVRIGELLELREEDLDFERLLLHVRRAKGRKDRYTIFSKRASCMFRTQ